MAAIALAAVVGGCAAQDAGGGTVADEVLRVGLDDYVVRAGADAVAAGELRIEVSNVGGDQHDLQVDAGGRTLGATDVLGRGDEASLTIAVPVRVDDIELWCTLPGHRSQGMTTTVSVRQAAEPAASPQGTEGQRFGDA